DRALARRLVSRAIRITLLVEFLVHVYVMPLIVELLFVPIVGSLVLIQTFAESKPELAPAKRFAERSIGIATICLATYVAVSAVADINGLLTRERGEALLLPSALTLALAPLLYVLASWSRWDRERGERRWQQSRVAF